MATIHRVAYTVGERPGRGRQKTKSWWLRIGVTFLNKDDSETIFLDALPVNGKIILRQPIEKPENTK